MAINIIENVTIDNANKAFGGYIYQLSYQVGVGGELTSLKVTFINEEGEYFISEEDLKSSGAVTEILIGSNFYFYGYPFGYDLENSSNGKILTVEYVDESIVHLDKRCVQLNGRIGSPVPPNVITLGQRRIRKAVLGQNLELSVDGNPLLDPEDTLLVGEIKYTFPQLIAAITDIIEIQPVLTSDHSAYFNDYTGTLREVLSSWCSDLGLSFYWQNRKLNFIDLRNPETFEIIRTRVNNILAGEKPESVEESISLRDTFTRAHTSFYGRDGSIILDNEPEKEINYSFSPLRLENAMGIGKSTNGKRFFPKSPTEKPYVDYIKTAHYGIEYMIVQAANNSNYSDYTYLFSDGNTKNSWGIKRLSFGGLTPVLTQATKVSTLNSYIQSKVGNITINWFEIDKSQGDQINVPATYKAAADYYGKYYYHSFSSEERYKENFSRDDMLWYHKKIRLKDTILNEELQHFADYIPNYDTLTIEGWILQNPSLTISDLAYDSVAFGGTRLSGNEAGFAIIVGNPQWRPANIKEFFDIDGDGIFLIEPTTESSVLNQNCSYLGITAEVSQSSAPVGQLIDLGSLVRLPIIKSVTVQSIRTRTAKFDTVDPRIELCNTSYPENFDTANVARCEINQNNLDEASILAEGHPDDDHITFSKFNAAHNRYVNPIFFSQVKPSFSKSFELPYLNLASPPKIEDGFQSLDISYGSDGLTARYTFGTENFRLPNINFYLSSFWNSKTKQLEKFLGPKIVINNRSRYFIR